MPIAKQDADQLMNMARVRLPGSSDAGLKAELYDTMSEFFEDSRCWLESIQFNVVTDTTNYQVVPTEGQIIGLVGVRDSSNQAQGALMPDIGTIILSQIPNIAQAPLYYYAIVSKNVSLPTGASNLPVGPDWLLPRWHTGILDGLLGRMMSHKEKPYSDEKRSSYHLKKFRNAVAQARVAALRQHTLGAQAWRFPQGFATNSQKFGVPGFGGSDRSF